MMSSAMRRFARHLFTTLSVLSLLLCVAACVMWARSYHYCDEWYWAATQEPGPEKISITRTWWLATSGGGLWFARDVDFQLWTYEPFHRTHLSDLFSHKTCAAVGYPKIEVDRAVPSWPTVKDRVVIRRPIDVAGIVVQDSKVFLYDNFRPERYTAITVPFWFLALIFSALPLTWTARWRRRHRAARRRSAGRCPACGYDLRATPERCPDCGHGAALDDA